jgi:hypothetical protein
MYALGYGYESVGYTSYVACLPAGPTIGQSVVGWAYRLLPGIIAALLVAELLGRRRAPLLAATAAAVVGAAIVALPYVAPSINPCTGKPFPFQVPWLLPGSLAVAVLLLVAASRLPLTGRRPGPAELAVWAAAAVAAAAPTVGPGILAVPWWSCSESAYESASYGAARPVALDLIDMRILDLVYFGLPLAVLSGAALAAFTGRRGIAFGGAALVLAFGSAGAAIEFRYPTCGPSRIIAAFRAAEWVLVIAAGLMVAAALLPARSLPPALDGASAGQ